MMDFIRTLFTKEKPQMPGKKERDILLLDTYAMEDEEEPKACGPCGGCGCG